MGLHCGVQPGSRTLLRDSAPGCRQTPPSGLRSGAPQGFEIGFRCWSLLRCSAPSCSRTPGSSQRSGCSPRRRGKRSPVDAGPDTSPARLSGAGLLPLPAADSQWRGTGSALPAPSCLPWHLPRPHLPGLRAFSCPSSSSDTVPGGGSRSPPVPGAAAAATEKLNGTRALIYGNKLTPAPPLGACPVAFSLSAPRSAVAICISPWQRPGAAVNLRGERGRSCKAAAPK